MSDQQRVVDWLDDVLAWLREPLTEMPVHRVMARLRTAFDIVGSSWIEQHGLLHTQMINDPPGCGGRLRRHRRGVHGRRLA